MKINQTHIAILVACVVMAIATQCVITPQALAQRPERRPDRGRGRPVAKKKEDSKKPATPEKKESKPIIAIVGGDVHTVTREVIRRGTVLVQGDKILDVGQDIKIPKGATVIDATGKHVTPGFIAMRMSRVGVGFGSAGTGLADSLDPFDRNIKFALGVGITSGAVSLGSSGRRSRRRAPNDRFLGLEPEDFVNVDPELNPDFGDPDSNETCPCCGLPIQPTEPITPSTASAVSPTKYAVIKLSYGELGPMLVTQTPFFAISSSSLTGSLNRHAWRASIAKARAYLKAQAEHEAIVKSGKKSTPPRKTVTDDYIRLVKRETYLRTDANSVESIRGMIALADELDYKLMLDGVVEGWLTATELGKANVPVIITPRNRRSATRGKEDSSGSSIEMSGILESAGVPFAIGALSSSISLNGLAGRDLTSLPLEAAFAVRGGCSESTALAALTIVPARMLGLQDRLGSIDKGKDADLLILDGPPLDYRTYVEIAIVSGKVRYDRVKDHVYPVFDRATLK